MPVPIRETPLGREWLEEGRAEGRRETDLATTTALLEERFGTDERIPAVAEALAELDLRRRVHRIIAATSLDDLAQP